MTHQPCKEAKVITVIETCSVYGSGTEHDPNRIIRQYWDFEGKLLATNDPIHQQLDA